MLIYNDNLEVWKVETRKHTSYESELWKVNLHNKINFSLLGVYHPPQSTNTHPDSIFIDKPCGEVHDLLPENRNFILLSDLNIHINDLSNADAVMLVDALSALGLQ